MGIGKTIAKYRNAKGWTQEELAELSFISSEYLRAIEEENKTPHIKALARIAEALGVSIEDLLKD